MNEPDYWYPKPELLLLTYKSNKTRYHGLDHVLRVWLYAQLLIDKISKTEEIDPRIVSASVLLHEYGRNSDRKDNDHLPQLEKWLNNTFPVLWPVFDDYQLEMIKICSRSVGKKGLRNQITEALIVNDANTLDGRNKPLGKIDPNDLTLQSSKDLIQIVNNIYEKWQYYRSRKNSEFSTLRKILKDFPQLNIETPPPLNKYLDEYEYRDWITHFKSLEKVYVDLESRCIDFQNALLSGEKIVSKVRQIDEMLQIIDQLEWQSDISTQAILFKANQVAYRSLKIGLVDHGVHPSKRKMIKKTYVKAKKNKESVLKEEISLKGLYNILLSSGKNNFFNTRTSLIEYAAKRGLDFEVLVYFSFNEDLDRRYVYSMYNDLDTPELSDIVQNFSNNDLRNFSRLLINGNQKLLQKGLEKIDSGEKNCAEKIFQYIVELSVDLLTNVDLSIEETTQILQTINEIVQASSDYELNIHLKNIQDLVNDSLSTKDTLRGSKNSLPSKNLNVFNLYDGSKEEISGLLLVFEELLLSLCNKDWNCDELISEYLLPCSLTPEFDYSISEDLIKDIEDTQISINTRKMLELRDEAKYKNPHPLVLNYLNDISRDNLDEVLDPSKYHSQISNRNGYSVISNPIRISTLSYVIENETTLLSTYNVLKADRLVYEHQLNQIEGDYYSRIRYRDGLERANSTRRPNILSDHIYYGMLINENDAFMYKKYLYRNNYCLLVFRNEVAERSIFNLHDASWKNQQIDVLYDDAKYMYEKIRDQIMNDSSIFNQYYIEAGITNGVSMADISKVLINKKALKKKRNELEIVRGSYPEVEIVTL